MPAPDLETLYDFETQFDSALKQVLDANVGITYTPSTPLEEVKTPYLKAEFNQRNLAGPASTPLLRISGMDPQIEATAFEGQILVNLMTDRIMGHQPNKLRGKLRMAMSPSAGLLDETVLPWLQVILLEEVSSSRDVESDSDVDNSALAYRVLYVIRPDAWPV